MADLELIQGGRAGDPRDEDRFLRPHLEVGHIMLQHDYFNIHQSGSGYYFQAREDAGVSDVKQSCVRQTESGDWVMDVIVRLDRTRNGTYPVFYYQINVETGCLMEIQGEKSKVYESTRNKIRDIAYGIVIAIGLIGVSGLMGAVGNGVYEANCSKPSVSQPEEER